MKVHGLWITCLFCLLSGCGGSNSIKVSGLVTLEGKPLEKGLIQFVPQDGRGAIAADEIQDGKYSIEVVSGLKRVEVTSAKVVGRRKGSNVPGSPEVDVIEEGIPREYNVESKLQADVSQERTKFDFSLTVSVKP